MSSDEAAGLYCYFFAFYALREAMIEAEKAGGRGPEVAAAGFC